MLCTLAASDLAALRDVFYSAFSSDEAPSTLGVIEQIIRHPSQPESIVLGYRQGEALVGAVAVSPIFIQGETDLAAYILAPLAVHANHQKQGVARQLIQACRQALTTQSVDVLLVYGDPNFYGRFGFAAETAQSFVPPYPLEFEFGWQALWLSDRALRPANQKPGQQTYPFSCVDALSDPSLW